MATPVSYSDPSLQILSLLSNLGGTQQTGTTTSTSSPAATAALEAILKTQMGQTTPEGMTAIINSIFQQGMRQVPKLGMQYAQAAGARTSKNSPLAYASENLQRQLSEAAASALLTAQQQASNTAAQLANSSKTTTTSQTSKPKNQSLMALPFLLGQAGNVKKGITDLKDWFSPETAGTGFGSVPGGSGVDGFIGNNPSAFIADSGSSGLDPSMFTGSDTMFDIGSALSSADWAPMTDAISNAADFDFSGLDGFDLGAFFADGGLVSKKQLMKKKAPGYADGGQVRGENTLTPTGTTELNMFNTSPSAASDADFGGGNAIPTPQMSVGPSLEEDVLSFFTADTMSGSGYNAGNTRTMNKNGINYQLLNPGQPGAEGEAGYTGISPQLTEIVATPESFDPSKGGTARVYDRSTGNATRNMAVKSDALKGDIGMITSAVLAAIGMATGNPALAFAKSVGTRAAGNAAQTMFANGGEVDGPGHGTSDSIPIRVSDGEYIIPADTVEMFGVEFFDMLKDSTHTPASMQRFHAPGTSRNQQR